jgi:hypothetical protein
VMQKVILQGGFFDADSGGGGGSGSSAGWFHDPVFWMAMLVIIILLAGTAIGLWLVIRAAKDPSKMWLVRWNAGPGAVVKRVKPGSGVVRYKNADGDPVTAVLEEGAGRQTRRGWAYIVDDKTGKCLHLPTPGSERGPSYSDGRDVAAAEEDAYVKALNSSQPEGLAEILGANLGLIVIVGFIVIMSMLGGVMYMLRNGGAA